MAWHHCHRGDHEFWIGTPGRPPKNCEQHGGPKAKTGGEPAPVTGPIDMTPVDVLPTDTTPTGGIVVSPQDVITEDEGKTNFYPGSCHWCSNHVTKNSGVRFKVNDKWTVAHTDCHDMARRNGVVSQQTADTTTPVIDATTPTVDIERIVKHQVNRAITMFVDDTLPPMLKAAMMAAEVVRHEIVVNGEVLKVEGTTNKYFPQLVTMLSAGRPMKRLNIALPGPAGSGKSYMAVQAAKALGLSIGIISFGPLTNTSKLFGYMDATGNYVRTPFREIWEHGGIFLADEMDNAHPGLLAELNQALAGDVAAFADGMVERHPEFRCIATMNTFGNGPDRRYNARNILDKATKNRFVWLEVGYDEKLETAMGMAFATTPELEVTIGRWIRLVQTVRANCEPKSANEKPLDYVFSPRNTEQGAMLLEAGMSWDDVINVALFADVSAEHRGRLMQGVNV